jgi:hypothetical protein
MVPNYMQSTIAVKTATMKQQRTSECLLKTRFPYGLFRKIRVRSGLVKTPVVPTAQSVPFGVAVIPCRRLLELGAFGLVTKFHCKPSQFSVNVN